MVIKDLFSHKIHSSKDSWANKLVDLAFIFNEFDGNLYDRSELEKRLSEISPRASSVSRDPSKFRDEISAYPAYLGLYRVELFEGKWHFFLSDTAKKFLVVEEPNVPAFMILQLLLFQYPNGMGVAYYSNSDSIRIQANTRDRTLEFIENKVHLSPLRLICKALEGNANRKSVSIFDASITYDEIFALANDPRIYTNINPQIEIVVQALEDFDSGKIAPPDSYESRFHILKHTDFIVPERSKIHLRNPVNKIDEKELVNKFQVINTYQNYFSGFDHAMNSDEILEAVIDSSWGNYFDGIKTLNADTVEVLTAEKGLLEAFDYSKEITEKSVPKTFDFRKRDTSKSTYSSYSYPKSKTDPEITRIRRQKSNLNHKVILQKLEEYLESIGCEPLENDHIDLFAKIPNDGKYLFEVKSTTAENLLSQTRKGISQLYEYRFRYKQIVGYDVNLCLVLPEKPKKIEWLEEYLCEDRKIGLLWFNDDGRIEYPNQWEELIYPLINNS